MVFSLLLDRFFVSFWKLILSCYMKKSSLRHQLNLWEHIRKRSLKKGLLVSRVTSGDNSIWSWRCIELPVTPCYITHYICMNGNLYSDLEANPSIDKFELPHRISCIKVHFWSAYICWPNQNTIACGNWIFKLRRSEILWEWWCQNIAILVIRK